MKILILTTFLFSILAFADTKESPKQAPQAKPRWEHLMDAEGKILATIDNKSGEIEYKEDAEKVVPLLLRQLQATVQGCNAQIEALKNPPKTPTKKK